MVEGDAQAFDDAEVIDVQGDRLRVIDHGSSRLARIALWIDEADTAPQLVSTRHVSSLPRRSSTSPRVRPNNTPSTVRSSVSRGTVMRSDRSSSPHDMRRDPCPPAQPKPISLSLIHI